MFIHSPMASPRAVRDPVEASFLFHPSAVPPNTEHLAKETAGGVAIKIVTIIARIANRSGPVKLIFNLLSPFSIIGSKEDKVYMISDVLVCT
jgi:hypothetical protein